MPLKHLGLYETNVDDDGVQKYIKDIPLTTLKIFSDDWNKPQKITGRAISCLSEMPTLTDLSLDVFSCTDEDLFKLTKLPLKSLYLSRGQVPMDERDVEKNFKEKIPSLEWIRVRDVRPIL